MHWTLQLNDDSSPLTLAVCDKNCNMVNTFEGLYTARITDIHKTTMIIKPKNNRKVYDNVELVNGTLECSHGDDAGCGLNLVGKYTTSTLFKYSGISLVVSISSTDSISLINPNYLKVSISNMCFLCYEYSISSLSLFPLRFSIR